MATEKVTGDSEIAPVEHTEHHHRLGRHTNYDEEDIKGRDFTQHEGEVPKGYFTSIRFIGSMIAIPMFFTSGQGGFSMVATVITQINADIGPSPNIVWLALSYLLTTSVGLIIVGRVTDIFGRRWWFICASILGFVGSIICARAPNVNALIAGQTLIGAAASVQLSYSFAITELVPITYRFLASAYIFGWCIPFTGFGPIISYSFIYNTSVGWRGIYYFFVAMNGCSAILLYIFYHPPNFGMKHGSNRQWEFIKNFDYVGTFLVTAGLLLFIMGVSWGGDSVYPWKSAAVISTMIIGFFLLVAFFAWEIFANLKEPLLPLGLFRNQCWLVSVLLWGTGSALYYSCAILWPAMVSTLYGPGHSWVRNGFVASLQGSGIILGEWTSACFKRYTEWQLRVLFALVGILLACMKTCTPDTYVRASALMFFASYFIGWCEMINSNVCSISLDDQREIGAGCGTGGSARSFFASIGSAIFSAVLTIRTTKNVSTQVPAALASSGLNATSMTELISGIAGNPAGDFTSIPGVTSAIAKTALRAYQNASADAYGTVFLSTLSFSIISVIISFWARNVNDKLTKDLTTPIYTRRGEIEEKV